MALVVYGSSFRGSGNPQAADCVAPDFSDLPSTLPAPNGLAYLFIYFLFQIFTKKTDTIQSNMEHGHAK